MTRLLQSFFENIIYSHAFDILFRYTGGSRLYANIRVGFVKKRLLANAIKEFKKGSNVGNISDYKQALDKHLISYNEYAYQYDFPHKSEQERDEYITRLKMVYFYWRYVPNFTKPLFVKKNKFLEFFKDYIHRKWIYVPNSTYEVFVELISNYDCIVKPCSAMRGQGVFKIYKNTSRKDDRKLFEYCRDNGMLIEQCIEACDELKVFHPQSLNTIRIITISNREKAEVFGSIYRMGIGDSVVDNAHAGGIFGLVNVKNGEIVSDGINTKGELFIYHPDTNLKIKGYKIPKWKLICDACCEATKLTDNIITGWDVIINNQGEVEFIEANNGSDFDIIQLPFQIGIKKRLYSLIKEYSGIDMK